MVIRLCLLLLPFLMGVPLARADFSTDQVEMAANGRFDLLEKSIESRSQSQTLDTKDQHALCFAYSKTKRYSHLLTCLDTLEEKLKKGSRRTRLFGLDDGTPTVHIMRAEAMIELGQYAEAAVAAENGLRWLRDNDSEDLDMVFNAMSALSLARTLGGDESGGRTVAHELAAINLGLLSDFSSAKAMALARIFHESRSAESP